jgi:hypothetical protein
VVGRFVGVADDSSSKMDVPEKSSAVLTWDRDQVSSFLASLRWTEGDASLAAAVASASRQAGVDGAALLELGPDAWKELGVESAVRQAQYVAAVRKLTTTRNDAVAHAARALRESQYPETDDDKPTSEFKLWAWVYPWLTSDGGTEHKLHWSHSIANAKADGADVKEHYMAFLGMYNLLDLLAFTIAIQWLSASTTPTEPIDLIIYICAALSGVASVNGCLLSAVAYNTCSAVSPQNFHAFAKAHATLRMMKWCASMNDRL